MNQIGDQIIFAIENKNIKDVHTVFKDLVNNLGTRSNVEKSASPLMLAIKLGNVSLCKLLIDLGALVNYIGSWEDPKLKKVHQE